MKIITRILILLLIGAGLLACDDYGQYEKEMYEKKIYIVSRAENVFSLVCEFDNLDSLHNISISCSGSNKIERDVTVTLEDDTILLPKYNFSNFDIDSTKYARTLSKWRYRFPSMTMTLKAGEEDVYGLLPFYIHPDNLLGLSPDSIYFIPLAIKSVSDYTVNAEKFNALVRIYLKNKYAETQELSYYTMKGFYGSSPDENLVMNTNKAVSPISPNAIRMYMGTTSPAKPTPELIHKSTIKIEVNADRTVDITPYNPDAGTLEVEQLPIPSDNPDFLYTNIFEEIPDKYVKNKMNQRFLLYYRYRTMENGSWSNWTYIREIISRIKPAE
ncbi:DUF1735 domain-containing protein [Prevotella sp. 10(H)]|uniref:DUF1735 domain-containing protein n=1 Tax=Prevotella sp. 10(H) TaxID=1158294 RepID=UPI0004A746EE|nr:DUF1735 domain-containing protein [Prevotella sp. 10(H)]